MAIIVRLLVSVYTRRYKFKSKITLAPVLSVIYVRGIRPCVQGVPTNKDMRMK